MPSSLAALVLSPSVRRRAARIVDDSSRTGLALRFSDLGVRQYVEVEFCEEVVARAYEIDDGTGFGAGPEIEGRDLGVDLMTREIRIGRSRNRPDLVARPRHRIGARVGELGACARRLLRREPPPP